jgi:hypothetical protein
MDTWKDYDLDSLIEMEGLEHRKQGQGKYSCANRYVKVNDERTGG